MNNNTQFKYYFFERKKALIMPCWTIHLAVATKLNEKYKSHDNLIIGRAARKTIRYIEKNTVNFPNKYGVLRERIIGSCYNILVF